MSRFEDRQSLAYKIEWEGGIYESLHYGIKPDDMPEGDTELEAAWLVIYDAFRMFEIAMERVEELMEDYL